jgi:hypothetical protein
LRLLLNIIWFVFAGLWMAIGYAFAALICFRLHRHHSVRDRGAQDRDLRVVAVREDGR